MSEQVPSDVPELIGNYPSGLPRPIATSGSYLTVVCQVYHQPAQGLPTPANPSYGCQLESDEQPYTRWFNAGSEWKPLDRGWLEAASLLILQNEEGRYPATRPSAEEKQAIAERVVEIGLDPGDGDWNYLTPVLLVRPGRTCTVEPADLKNLMVRCRKGAARCVLYLFPR